MGARRMGGAKHSGIAFLDDILGDPGTRDRLARWRDLRARKFAPGTPDLTADEEREYWVITSEVLQHVAVGMSRYGRPVPNYEDWWALMVDAGAVIGEALEGRAPAAWKGRPGNRPSRLEAERWQAVAAYHKALEEGLFPDDAPTRFLCETFGEGERTIQGWYGREPGVAFALLRSRLSWVEGEGEGTAAAEARREQARAMVREVARTKRRRTL